MKNMMLALILLSILLISSFIVQVQADSTWSIQTVDENGAPIGGLSMALDSKDNPHLCYIDYVDGYYRNPTYLTYASWNGSDWLIQNVTYAGHVQLDVLTLDSDDNPHVVYHHVRTSGQGLAYASWTGENWSIQSVDSEGGEGSLALDSADNPHIVYESNGELKYAILKNSNWTIQTVDTEEGLTSPSLALDSHEHPHVIYACSAGNGNTTVKYATLDGLGWDFQTVISSADVVLGKIALDVRGYPHFTYYTSGLLMYASWNWNAWNMQVVDSAYHHDRYPGFLIFDFNNNPHIGFIKGGIYPNNEMELVYAEWTGTTWGIHIVDSDNIITLGSIALDSSGNPCIGYKGNYHGMYFVTSAMYAKRTLILSPNQILWVAMFVSLVLAVLVIAILKKRKR